MKAARPVYLNLLRIKLPIPGIVSILHRVSGVVIFLGLPFLLYILHHSLISQNSFDHLKQVLAMPGNKFILWVVLAAVVWHVLAGIRHLLMDVGVGESLTAARMTAWLVAIISFGLILLLGVWLW